VQEKELPQGILFIWSWGDEEIEDLKLLKSQLNAIAEKGFSCITVSLNRTRYELNEPKVIRAISQSSQWAAVRKIPFWIQADPRRSSRSLINETGEKTQSLLLMRRPDKYFNRDNLNIAKVKSNRFELRSYYPQFESFPLIQDRAVSFNPVRLEKAFLFQMKDRVILKDTIMDITASSRFCPNISKGYVDVFGEILIPKGETWWVLAFPMFDTNLYDYAGRESNDLIGKIVEDLFDAGTYLNGILWDKISYFGDVGRISVSPSIYNSFKAEFDYDLRDVVYGLVLNVDDQSHIRTRHDYHALLQNLAFYAQKDLYHRAHSFFGELKVGTQHSFYWHNHHTNPCYCSDPWQGLDSVNIGLSGLEKIKNGRDRTKHLLTMMAITKSLGIFSQNKMAFASLPDSVSSFKEISFYQDLMALFSIRLMYHEPIGIEDDFRPTGEVVPLSNRSIWKEMKKINERCRQIREITNFIFPEANVLLVYPFETIASMDCENAEALFYSVHHLTGMLISHGIQLDVISASLLKECRLSSNFLHINGRKYEAMIYPYPQVLDPKILEILSLLDKVEFPLFLGGKHPEWTTQAKRIPHTFPLTFDPDDKNLGGLFKDEIPRLFHMPENALGTLIRQSDDLLFLLHPEKPGGPFKGKVQYKEFSFEVPRSSKLTIYRKQKNKPVERVL
jgi:hypothetical protein